MPGADTTERTAIGKRNSPLPIEARRRLWDAIWERLLAPVLEESRNRSEHDRLPGDDDRQPLAADAGQRDGEAA